MPPFVHHIFACTNERTADDPKGSCKNRGAVELHAFMKERCHQLGLKGNVRVNKAGCLDTCADGPAFVVYGSGDPPEGVWYTLRDKAEVEQVITEHLQGGRPVDALRMPRPRP
jgi:(2Fe-2S) ferredoxin